MDEANAGDVDKQDTDAQELYRKGLKIYRDKLLDCHFEDTSAITDDGASLIYETISEKETAILCQLLGSGPPVKELILHDLCLDAFKVAFHNLDQCPSLNSMFLDVDFRGKNLGTIFSGVFRGLSSSEFSCENPGSAFADEIASYIRENKLLKALRLRHSCGGDKGAAVITKALACNDTLKTFALHDIRSSFDTFISYVKMLAFNSTLDTAHPGEVRCGRVDQVWALLAQERCAGVFQRLQFVWPDELLSVLTVLVRREACFPALSVGVTSSVNEGLLQECFDAMVVNTLRELYIESELSDALANGIASVVKRSRSLREIYSDKNLQRGNEHRLLTILNVLKENTSITDFTMCVRTMTPEVATSLSELLVANKSLKNIHLREESDISPRIEKTILQALLANYTLTELMVFPLYNYNNIRRSIKTIRDRNLRILDKAADFVISGGELSDKVGPFALKKVHSSAGFVEMLMSRTKKEERRY